MTKTLHDLYEGIAQGWDFVNTYSVAFVIGMLLKGGFCYLIGRAMLSVCRLITTLFEGVDEEEAQEG